MNLKINKILLFIFLIFCLIIFTNNISAISLNIDSFQIRTDSFDFFANTQQGNYYDNVDLRVNFYLDQLPNNYNYVPILVRPKIYGLLPNGQSVLVDVLPTTHYNIYSTNMEQYVSNNLFYLYPNYVAYMIALNINSLDNLYFDQSYAYVIVDHTIYENSYIEDYFEDFQNIDDNNDTKEIDDFYDDFSLSGLKDIYLDEDETKNYKLYITNHSDKTLQIISVTTSEPTRLDIKSIDHLEFVNSNSKENIIIKLLSETVSNDYVGDLTINVVARYLAQNDIYKYYNFNYHIEDESSKNTSNCSDLDIENYRFEINDNSITNKEIIIENKSDDYYFEINKVSIEEDPILNINIIDFKEEIQKNNNGYINLEIVSEDVLYNSFRNLELEIEGYFKRENREPKKCKFSQNLRINVINDTSNQELINNTEDCSNIIVFVPDIIQEENTIKNYNKNKGFFVINNSNKEFTIRNLIINDNTNLAKLTKNTIPDKIYANSDVSLDFDLQTNEITNNYNFSKASISVIGTFLDGTICNSNDIKKYFDLAIVSLENKCSKIGIQSKIINSRENTITLFNNTDMDFYVNDFLKTNNYNLEYNISSTQHTINKENTKDINVGFLGNGILELKISGTFSDGTSCLFNETISGIFTSSNISKANFSRNLDNCLFQLEVPSYLEIDDSYETINLNFINLSSNGGKITIIGNGAVINPSIIYLDGEDNFQKSLVISNFSDPKSVFYKVQLNGCETKTDFTNLEEKINISERINFITYPNLIKPSSKIVNLNLEINNSYNTTQEIIIKLSGFPQTWNIPKKDIILDSRNSTTLNYNFYIDDINISKKYNGYIEIYKNNLKINSVPLTIDLTKPSEELIIKSNLNKSNDFNNIYILELYLENKSNSYKEYIVDFNLNDDYIIEGNKEINLLVNENKTIEYKIVSQTLLKDNSKINLIIKDKISGEQLESKDVIYKEEKKENAGLTGFLIFNSFLADIVFIIILIIVLIIIIINIISKIKTHKNKNKIIK
jgi:hypothetical protein